MGTVLVLVIGFTMIFCVYRICIKKRLAEIRARQNLQRELHEFIANQNFADNVEARAAEVDPERQINDLIHGRLHGGVGSERRRVLEASMRMRSVH